jgi:hypothetical protein
MDPLLEQSRDDQAATGTTQPDAKPEIRSH